MAQTWAIVVAAGEGKRFGADRPKAFVGFQGDVLLERAITLLEDHATSTGWSWWCRRGGRTRPSCWPIRWRRARSRVSIAGGATRAQSVAAGLAELPDTADLVLVHDAARPFASHDLVTRVLAALTDADGAVPGPAGGRHDQAHRRRGSLVHARARRSGARCRRRRDFGPTALRRAYDRPRWSCTPPPTARPCSRTRACEWCGYRASGRTSRSPSRTTCAWPRRLA